MLHSGDASASGWIYRGVPLPSCTGAVLSHLAILPPDTEAQVSKCGRASAFFAGWRQTAVFQFGLRPQLAHEMRLSRSPSFPEVRLQDD